MKLFLLPILILITSCGPSLEEYQKIENELIETKSELKATKSELNSVKDQLDRIILEQEETAEKLDLLIKEVQDSLHSLVSELKNKNYAYESPGLFMSTSGDLLKRNGYDDSLLKPKNDKVYYYNLINDIIRENSEYLKFGSRVKLNKLLESWEVAQVDNIRNTSRFEALYNAEYATEEIKRKSSELLNSQSKIFKSTMKSFSTGMDNYINEISIK